MATQDYNKKYVALRQPASSVQVPNTVSRSIKVGDRSFQTVVYESGKPVLDAELQLNQDASQWSDNILRAWQAPTGWLRGSTHYDSFNDYIFVDGTGVTDNGPDAGLPDNRKIQGILSAQYGNTMVNAFLLPRLELMVAGRPVVVEYTYTETTNRNLVILQPPSTFTGQSNFSRTDFVFLECWLSLVAPSPRATGYVQVIDAASITVGDAITINGTALTAVLVSGPPNTFVVDPASEVNTAANIAVAINTFLSTTVIAKATSSMVNIGATQRGAVGNAITLAVTTVNPDCLAVSGPTLVNGADRPDKPAQDKLYCQGNVLSPEATWFDDEMEDPTLDIESTQRVQLQYRIRTTGEAEAVDYKLYPDGFSTGGQDAKIVAQGNRASPVQGYPFVPADNSRIWDNSNAPAYGKTDTGLWVAGDGSDASAQALGAVDGFVYAVPLCFVFRHNDASSPATNKGFNPNLNVNGAPLYIHTEYINPVFNVTIPSTKSDRPDAEFADVISNTRVMDLRRHVVFPGIDYASEAKYQLQALMDGNFRTWQVDTTDKQQLGDNNGGDTSTRYLICNEIGRQQETTSNGVFVRNFDHIARRFGQQPVVERVVFAFNPTDRSTGNPGKYVTKAGADTTWDCNDVLVLDLTQLNVSTMGGLFQGTDGGGASWLSEHGNFSDVAPQGTVITDILSIYHDDGYCGNAINQTVQTSLTEGLGTQVVSIKLDYNGQTANGGVLTGAAWPLVGDVTQQQVGSPRRIFVEFEITYPLGLGGATDTPTVPLTPDAVVYTGTGTPPGTGAGPGAMLENQTTYRPSDMEIMVTPNYREGFRELHAEYIANGTTVLYQPSPGTPVTDQIVSRNATLVYPPRRMVGEETRAIEVNDISTGTPVAKTVDVSHTEYGSSSRKLQINSLDLTQSLCEVSYFAQDPVPNFGADVGYQISLYYRANAPQTAGVMAGPLGTPDNILPNPLVVEPLIVGDAVWSGQTGVGSVELSFPYTRPLDPIPAIEKMDSHTYHRPPECVFCATTNMTTNDFNVETGLITLHPYVQADSQNNWTVGSADTPPVADAEFRACYTKFDPTTYLPTIMSIPLYGASIHKVFVPVLARIVNDPVCTSKGLIFRKNELVLLVLTRLGPTNPQSGYCLSVENNILFNENKSAACVGVYRTQNLLMVVGDR